MRMTAKTGMHKARSYCFRSMLPPTAQSTRKLVSALPSDLSGERSLLRILGSLLEQTRDLGSDKKINEQVQTVLDLEKLRGCHG